MGVPESTGELSRLVRTWATPPAVPAVRSLTVFDMAEVPKIEQKNQAKRADVGEQACRVTVCYSTAGQTLGRRAQVVGKAGRQPISASHSKVSTTPGDKIRCNRRTHLACAPRQEKRELSYPRC